LGGRHDQATLALADRRDQVDDASGDLGRLGLERQTLLRVQRREVVEVDASVCLLHGHRVDRVNLDERVVLLAALALAFARLLDGADDGVTLAQSILLDLVQRDVDVVLAGQVARRAHEGVVVENVEDARNRDEHVILKDFWLGLVVRRATAAAVTLAVVAIAWVVVLVVVRTVLTVATLAAAVLAVLIAVLAIAVRLIAVAVSVARVARVARTALAVLVVCTVAVASRG
jgi:hypothetical protein